MQELLAKPLAELPDPLAVPTLTARGRPLFFARVRPPGSKSLTNRALLLAALADGESTLRRPLAGADDTEAMTGALRALGAGVEVSADVARVSGVGGRWSVPAEGLRLDVANAGTAARFLSAAALLSTGPLTIDGNARMRERPIGELADVLEDLGARVEFGGNEGCPPLTITPPQSPRAGAVVEIGPTSSSQFVSGLLLVAPWLPGGLTLKLTGAITSRSYIWMTLGLLDELGAVVKTSDDLRVLRVAGARGSNGPTRGIQSFEYEIEPDASSATYFWAAAALFPGAVARIEGLNARSLQGDSGFPELLARMGATLMNEEGESPSLPTMGVRGPSGLAPVMADMSNMPDAAITLAVVAAFANGRSVLRGLRTLRVKESDRIAAMQAELRKVGVGVETDVLGDPDAVTITPPFGGLDTSAAASRVEFDTYDDHRLAMALSLIGLRRPNVWIKNPRCVQKTFPGFWKELAALY